MVARTAGSMTQCARPRSVRRRLRPVAGPVPAALPGVPAPRSARSVDVSVPHKDRDAAARRARDARIQLDPAQQRGLRRLPDRLLHLPLLRLEGFLPGYTFPRLPLSAYIPASARQPRGRLRPAAPVPRHQGVRPRRHHLPRGRPLPGRSASSCRPPNPGRTARSPSRPSAAAPAATSIPTAAGTDLCEHCAASRCATPPASLLRLTIVAHRAPGPDHLRRGGAPPRRVTSSRPSYRFAGPRRQARPDRRDGQRRATACCSASPTATRRPSGGPTSAGAGARTPTSTASARPDHGPLAQGDRTRGPGSPGRRRPGGARRSQAQAAGHPVRRGPPQHPASTRLSSRGQPRDRRHRSRSP